MGEERSNILQQLAPLMRKLPCSVQLCLKVIRLQTRMRCVISRADPGHKRHQRPVHPCLLSVRTAYKQAGNLSCQHHISIGGHDLRGRSLIPCTIVVYMHSYTMVKIVSGIDNSAPHAVVSAAIKSKSMFLQNPWTKVYINFYLKPEKQSPLLDTPVPRCLGK